MKKFLAVVFAVIMVVSAGVIAFAQGGFVSSPSVNPAPVIIEVVYDEGSCEPKIVITPYSERDTLDEKREEDIEDAYDEIAANEDLTNLCEALETVAAEKGVPVENLAISDLFDVTAYHNGNDHEYCGTIRVTLASETIKNFVALLHRNKQDSWEVVSDVIVHANENAIEFSARDFSPFAVVVDISKGHLPNTGEAILIPAIAMFVSAISLVVVLFNIKKSKKQEA